MNRLNFNNGTALVIGLLLSICYQLDRHNQQSTKSNKQIIVRQESNQIFEQWQVKEGSVDDGNTLTIRRGEEELKVRLCGIARPLTRTAIGNRSQRAFTIYS